MEERVLSVRTLSLPTVMESTAHAIASSTVDFPEPFSPTKKVTGDANWISRNERMTSRSNGKVSLSCELNSRTVIDLRWIIYYKRLILFPLLHRQYKVV